MNKKVTYFIYAMFFAAAVVFFLYYLFPSESVADYIENAISQHNPDLDVELDDVNPSFPPGLTLSGVKVDYRQQTAWVSQRIRFSPALLTLLSNNRRVDFNILSADGIINGRTEIAKKQTGFEINTRANLTDIEIGKIQAVDTYSSHQFSGILSGRVIITTDSTASLQTEAELFINGFKIALEAPLFNIETIEFKTINADLTINKSLIRVQKCTLKGRDMDGEISGTLSVRVPFENSQMNFSGVIRPHPEFIAHLSSTLPAAMFSPQQIGQNGLPFRIRGTVNNPGFSLR